jgi:hypothetical protein
VPVCDAAFAVELEDELDAAVDVDDAPAAVAGCAVTPAASPPDDPELELLPAVDVDPAYALPRALTEHPAANTNTPHATQETRFIRPPFSFRVTYRARGERLNAPASADVG